MSSEKPISRVGICPREHAEGVAHHGGAGDLAEGADMRQAGGAVAGLEDEAPVGFGMRLSRLRTLRASSKGQALLT